MAIAPHMDTDPWQAGGAVQLAGPVGASLRGPAFVALEAPPREMPRVLAGAARLLSHRRHIYCADACNRFDPYRFSQWARSMGLDPREVLQRVFLSRAFTVHQLTALATEEFPRLAAGPEPPLLVVLGIETLFLDEQLPRFEREHLFGRALAAMAQLRQDGGSILATFSPETGEPGVPPVRPWRERLARVADVTARLRTLAAGAFIFERLDAPRRRREPLYAQRFEKPVRPADPTQLEIRV